MQENIRVHERIKKTEPLGATNLLEGIVPKPVVLYLPPKAQNAKTPDLLIHFHGASFVPIKAVDQIENPFVLAAIHLGGGSSVNERPFMDPKVFKDLLDKITLKSSKNKLGKIYVSAFSAGYGAVRALLRSHPDQIDGILLLDGLHTDYIPDGIPLAKGSRLNTEKLKVFLKYARTAVNGNKKILITHSEIFPGTFASLTETTDWLLDQLNLKRTPVLQWGPIGMQQIGETSKGQFRVLSFAGNTAPDHVDHFHGMPYFLKLLVDD
ncbi:MAG: hypothetical protein AAFX53_14400 [Bacteroidota bacterium]